MDINRSNTRTEDNKKYARSERRRCGEQHYFLLFEVLVLRGLYPCVNILSNCCDCISMMRFYIHHCVQLRCLVSTQRTKVGVHYFAAVFEVKRRVSHDHSVVTSSDRIIGTADLIMEHMEKTLTQSIRRSNPSSSVCTFIIDSPLTHAHTHRQRNCMESDDWHRLRFNPMAQTIN